jgi:hypothetical protein
MELTRRRFLALTGTTIALPCGRTSRSSARDGYAIVDLGPCCTLEESLEGYARAADALTARIARSAGFWTACSSQGPSTCPLARARHIVVPAAGYIHEAVARELLACVSRGASVLVELGLAFSTPPSRADAARTFTSFFGISVLETQDLWPAGSVSRRGPLASVDRQFPYVEYTWPRTALVRDFSRITGLSHGGTPSAIARVRNTVVGVRRPMGRGTLVVLGSPLGPALRAGDAQAHAWLREFFST